MIKAIVNYTGYTDDALGPLAAGVASALNTNVGIFPAPVPSIVTFMGDTTLYTTALAALKSNPSQANTQAKNAARATLEADLASIATYVNLIAAGDGAKVALSGLPSYDTRTTPPPALREAPTDLRLKQGIATGSIDLRCHQQVSSDSMEAQTCTGDPGVEANWTHALTFPGSSATLTGLTPGAMVFVRVRSIGPGGTLSPWSSVENMRVI